jgi:predicted nicotinamide N-methyase
VGAKTYRIVHPAAADVLIDETDFMRDERLPYWAELWPSAISLARYLSREDLSDRRAVELGCGVGLPSVVALEKGASVLATDHYEAALEFAAHNALLNTGRTLETALLDWRAPEIESLGRFDLVFAADVLYEARNAPVLAALVPRLLAPGGAILLADPRRTDAPAFLRAMEDLGFQISTEEDAVIQDGREVKVRLHRLRHRLGAEKYTV